MQSISHCSGRLHIFVFHSNASSRCFESFVSGFLEAKPPNNFFEAKRNNYDDNCSDFYRSLLISHFHWNFRLYTTNWASWPDKRVKNLKRKDRYQCLEFAGVWTYFIFDRNLYDCIREIEVLIISFFGCLIFKWKLSFEIKILNVIYQLFIFSIFLFFPIKCSISSWAWSIK